jgi:TPP-dependent pyruvate/acetoin dehydrogenase alpha subunit
MRRYPPFDPPEYVGFRPDPAVLAAWRRTIAGDPARRRLIAALRPADLLRMYEGMIRFRLHDIALKRWVRQGVISKAWLGTGEEAVTVGAVHALRKDDLVGPMIRNAGALHEMGMPVADMLKAYLGTGDQITRGRDLHTGDPARGVIPPNSMMANLVPVFTGIGLALRRNGGTRVALTWTGDGATRTAAFHQGMTFASTQRVPVVFVVQDNRVALGTPTERHTAGDLAALPRAYGITGLECDGNNILDVWAATRLLADRCRKGNGPALLVARTFRMGGHATHDEAEARRLFSAEQFRHWGGRDPIGTFEAYLMEAGPALDGKKRAGAGLATANRRILEAAERRVTAEIEAAAVAALASREDRMPEPEDAVRGVYAAAATAAVTPIRGRAARTGAAAARAPRRRPARKTGAGRRRRRVS